MSTLTEIAEFVESVLRLDSDTPVRGYDGTDIGPANEQAQALANRTKWLKEKIDGILENIEGITGRQYVSSINEKTGEVTIGYQDVGAAAEEHTHTPSDIVTTDDAGFVSKAEKKGWNEKQDPLISGSSIKTLSGESLLGSGNVSIKSKDIMVDDENQFVTYNQKQEWDKKQELLSSGKTIKTLNKQSLLGEGDISITYDEVGADKSGTASAVLDEHVTSENPHGQYALKTEVDFTYVKLNDANKPLGYLKLDDKGLLPADIAKLYEARYLIVDDATARLAVEKSMNITICLQIDEHLIYYINADADPSVDENWMPGGSAIVDNVVSAFGRSGIVTAQNGDYNADQITETDDRTFVSSDDRTQWNNKQDKLVSGTNIKTINKQSLLGSTDISITPESIGAAEKVHTHSAEDIEQTDERQFTSQDEKATWTGKQDALTSGQTLKTVFGQTLLDEGDVGLKDIPDFAKQLTEIIKAEGDVSITLSDDEKTIIVSKEKRSVNIQAVNGATADTVYSYEGEEDNFDVSIYALKEVLVKGEQNLIIDYSDGEQDLKRSAEPQYESDGTIIDTSLSKNYNANSIVDTSDYSYGGDLITIPATATAMSIAVNGSLEPQIPTMYDAGGEEGVKPIASSYREGYPVYRAYQEEMSSSQTGTVYNFWADANIWSKKKEDVWLGVDFGSSRNIMAYGFQYFTKLFSAIYTLPTAWEFQGSDYRTTGWVTLDKRSGQTITSTIRGWKTYKLQEPANYRYYRILITGVANANSYPAIPRFQMYNNITTLIKTDGGNYFTVDQNGKVNAIPLITSNRYQAYGFNQTPTPVAVSELSPHAPFRLCAEKRFSANITYYGKVSQIVIHNPIRDASIWDSMKSLKVGEYYNEDDANNIKFAATLDGKEFFILNGSNGEWESIGTLSLDTTGANTLLEKGMSLSVMAKITKVYWDKLLLSGGDSTRLGIAYGSMIAKKGDQVTPKTLEFEFTEISTWVKASQAEVKIGLNSGAVEFTPAKDGNYKFCYRFYK